MDEIDAVITHVSSFSPTPSLSAMLVNKYKLKENIISYSMSGMGCSTGPIEIEIAQNIL